MKRHQPVALAVVALLAVALAACGKKGASTPTEAFKSFYQAAKEKDVETYKSLMSERTLAKMKAEAAAKSKSLDEFLLNDMQKGLWPTLPELGEEKIDGNKATLQFKPDKATISSTVSFVKEDGSWKIDL